MNNRGLLSGLAGLAIFTVVGCGAVNKTTGAEQVPNKNSATVNNNSSQDSTPAKWDYVGTYVSRVDGTVTRVSVNSGVLKSISIHVKKTIEIKDNAQSVEPNYDGKTLTIYYNQRLTSAKLLKPYFHSGSELCVTFSQFAIPPKGHVIWGADFKGSFYASRHSFYDLTGNKVDIHTAPLF